MYRNTATLSRDACKLMNFAGNTKVVEMVNRNSKQDGLRKHDVRRRVGGLRRGDRSGFLLVLVMLVIAIAGLAALNFSNSMLTSHEIAQFSGAQLKAKMCAESGVQSVRLFLAYDRLSRLGMGGTWDNPSKFQALNVMPDLDPKRRGNFTVISPSLDASGYFSGIRYGLQNESAKINLNTLSQLDQLASSGSLAASAMGGLGLGAGGGGGGGSGQLLGGTGGQSGNNSNQNSPQNAPQSTSQNSSQTNNQSTGQNSNQKNGQAGGQAAGGPGGNSLASAAGSAGGADQLASMAGAISGNMAQTLLMGLPGMTEDVADAILDWLDEDEEPRALGAEFADYYQQLQPAYKPANGPLQSIEQLLLVRGVTPQLLFGYDENRNGVIDSAEQTKLSMGIPPGLAPGQLPVVSSDPNVLPPPPLGWAPYLTLHSQEKNVTNDGLARVNLNSQDLQALYDELMSVLGNDAYASFIVAYRLFGKPSAGGSNPLSGLMNSSSDAGLVPSDELLAESAIEHIETPKNDFENLKIELVPTSRVHYVAMILQPPRGGGQGGGGGFGPGGGRGGQNGPAQGGGGQGGGFGPRGGGQGGGQGQGGRGGGPGGDRGGQGGGRGGDRGGQDGGRGGQGGDRGGQGGGRGGQGGDGGGRGGQGGNGTGQGGGRGGQGGQGGGNGGAPQSPPKPWTAAAMSSLDLTQQGSVQLKQVLDLVDATVTITENGQQTVYTSPFTSLPLDVANYSPLLMDKLTTVEAKTIPGRINIMECPQEILLGLPGMTPEVVEQIIQARVDGSESETRKFETWIAAEGFVTVDQLRTLLPLITCGGDVFKAQVIGYLEGSAASSRVEAIVSGTGEVPEVLFFRRLDHLGRAFDVPTLGQRFDAGMNSGLGLR